MSVQLRHLAVLEGTCRLWREPRCTNVTGFRARLACCDNVWFQQEPSRCGWHRAHVNKDVAKRLPWVPAHRPDETAGGVSPRDEIELVSACHKEERKSKRQDARAKRETGQAGEEWAHSACPMHAQCMQTVLRFCCLFSGLAARNELS